jgi:hypothetical protein
MEWLWPVGVGYEDERRGVGKEYLGRVLGRSHAKAVFDEKQMIYL